MNRELFCQAILKFGLGVLMVGALLFLPAGTFDYYLEYEKKVRYRILPYIW